MNVKRALIPALLALALMAAPAAAATPPSFALWNAKFVAQDDKLIDELGDKCLALYGQTANQKVGECFVRGGRVILRSQQPGWERAVARISIGRSAPCKKAIHAYWLASRKATRASLIYLDSHPHTSMTEIASDFAEEPYATLKALLDESKRRAIRVCG
jgi:hypothetical protein